MADIVSNIDLSKHAKSLTAGLLEDFDKSVREAQVAMILRAKELTPPPPGAMRGRNTVTGALADHWGTRIEKEVDGSYKVFLFNTMPYASYVNDGHKVAKHFVPWLYIDSSGLLARHIPVSGEMLFGLIVGTKTSYVQPVHMVEKSQAAFLEAFDISMSNRLEERAKQEAR